jgi:hypothetical protein
MARLCRQDDDGAVLDVQGGREAPETRLEPGDGRRGYLQAKQERKPRMAARGMGNCHRAHAAAPQDRVHDCSLRRLSQPIHRGRKLDGLSG